MLRSEQELENLDKKISQHSQKSRKRALLTSLIIIFATLVGVSTIIISLDIKEAKLKQKSTELEQQVIPVKEGIEKTTLDLEDLAETIDNTDQEMSPLKQQEIKERIRGINRELQIYQRSLPSSEELKLE